jgi:AhpC/TSA family
MIAELLRGAADHVVAPGQPAPDFALDDARGEHVRLLDLRGRPVLLHFVSYTCPVTRGGVVPMRELHRRYGDRVQFLDIIVRQAHPGERHSGYRSYAEKLEDARQYAEEEGIVWPVLVDDLDATVQRAYGGLAAAAYLIDGEGRVAFCGAWGQSSALTAAIDDLLSRGGSGAPAGRGIDPLPHLGGAIVAGQGGPLRGGTQSLMDLELGFPGALELMLLGRLGRPVFAPLVLRIDPLPARTRLALVAGVAAWALSGLCIAQEVQRRVNRGGAR